MQTSVSLDPAAARAGMLADSGPRQIFSAIVSSEATAPAGGLNMGVGIFKDIALDAQNQYRAADGAAALGNYKFMGVSMYDSSEEAAASGSDKDYLQKDVFPLIRKGRVWVNSETAVKPGDPVHVRVVAGAGTPGYFRNAADGINTLDVSAYCSWVTKITGAGLAILEINFP